jgi:iron-sulfur cluster assembly accessory protein
MNKVCFDVSTESVYFTLESNNRMRVARRWQSSAVATPSPELIVSPRCAAQINSLQPPKRLRVGVDVGGCGGFQYRFSLDDVAAKPQAEDVVFVKDGAEVVADRTSLEFLNGAVIDYSVSLMSSAFRVLSNPVAESNCGCGTSFSVKYT